jgi:hypothetical protein
MLSNQVIVFALGEDRGLRNQGLGQVLCFAGAYTIP